MARVFGKIPLAARNVLYDVIRSQKEDGSFCIQKDKLLRSVEQGQHFYEELQHHMKVIKITTKSYSNQEGGFSWGVKQTTLFEKFFHSLIALALVDALLEDFDKIGCQKSVIRGIGIKTFSKRYKCS